MNVLELIEQLVQTEMEATSDQPPIDLFARALLSETDAHLRAAIGNIVALLADTHNQVAIERAIALVAILRLMGFESARKIQGLPGWRKISAP